MAVPEEIQKQVLAEATSATPNYSVDYNDPRFGKVESDQKQSLTELEQTYGGMVADSDKYFNAQIHASKDWADKQTQIQQEQTDFAIEKIEQQKDQAHKDYLKEQSGSYVDWQKQSNAYGTNAERIASNGLANTGFSESSQVSMYNTYQNRVAVAREGLNKAILSYDNAIKDAILQNNATLAEIAYKSLQQQLELSLQGFQYKNQLLIEQSDKKFQIKQHYDNLWQNTYNNIMREYELAEDVRQFDTKLEFDAEQNQLNREHTSKENQLNREFEAAENKLDREFEKEMAKINHQYELKLLDAKTKAEKEILAQEQANAIEKLNQQLANDKALLKYEYDLAKQKSAAITKSSSDSKSSGSKFASAVKNVVSAPGKAIFKANYNSGSGSKNSHSGAGGSFDYTPDYKAAVDYMKKQGVSAARASGIKTRDEFARTSTYQGKKMTYEQYIQEYVSTEISAAKVKKRNGW